MTDDSELVIKHSDIIYWYHEAEGLYKTKFLKDQKTKPKKTKHDLGYGYDVFIFKEKEYQAIDPEGFHAIIGDCSGYVEHMIKLGYSGIMVKKSAHRIQSIKHLLKSLLIHFGFSFEDYHKMVRRK